MGTSHTRHQRVLLAWGLARYGRAKHGEGSALVEYEQREHEHEVDDEGGGAEEFGAERMGAERMGAVEDIEDEEHGEEPSD